MTRDAQAGTSTKSAARTLPRSTRVQASSARWTPPHRCFEHGSDGVELGDVVGAGLSGEVVADGGDDELCPFGGGGSDDR